MTYYVLYSIMSILYYNRITILVHQFTNIPMNHIPCSSPTDGTSCCRFAHFPPYLEFGSSALPLAMVAEENATAVSVPTGPSRPCNSCAENGN